MYQNIFKKYFRVPPTIQSSRRPAPAICHRFDGSIRSRRRYRRATTMRYSRVRELTGSKSRSQAAKVSDEFIFGTILFNAKAAVSQAC